MTWIWGLDCRNLPQSRQTANMNGKANAVELRHVFFGARQTLC